MTSFKQAVAAALRSHVGVALLDVLQRDACV